MTCPLHGIEEPGQSSFFTRDTLDLWRQRMARQLPCIFRRELAADVSEAYPCLLSIPDGC